MNSSKAYLVAGGMAHASLLDILKNKAEDDIVVAVDSGLNHLHEIGLRPDIIVGDLDSVDSGLLPAYEGVELHAYNPLKDASDTELAIEICLSKGYARLLLLSALGKRFDHSLAHIHMLKKYLGRAKEFCIYDEYNKIYAKDSSFSIKKSESYAKYISFFNMGERVEDFSLSGMKYNLDKIVLDSYLHPSLCISNEIVDEYAHISFSGASLLIIESGGEYEHKNL